MPTDRFHKWDKFIQCLEEKEGKTKVALLAYKRKYVDDAKMSEAKKREKRYRQLCAQRGKCLPLNGKLIIPDDFE